MQLQSLVKPIYFPDPNQTTVMRMGLRPLSMSEWMMVDSDLPRFHQHKSEQGRLHLKRVYQALPQSRSAQLEFTESLRAHLLKNHGYALDSQGRTLSHPASGLQWDNSKQDLWHGSLWIQEDICILEPVDGQYRLTAASVCSPSNWDMEAKIGHTVDVIHDPVPGYQDEMAAKVNRLLRGIKVNKPIQRLNWSVQPGGDLFWRADLKDYSDDDERYWRVERQTLVRLPQTGAIVFGIRVFMHSFAVMTAYPDFRQNIDKLLARLPAEQRRYKNLF